MAKKKLRDLDALEISTVPDGAIGKTFLLLKSNGGIVMDKELLAKIMKSDISKEDAQDISNVAKEADASDETADVMKAVLRMLKAVEGEAGVREIMQAVANKAGLKEEEKKKAEAEVKKEATPEPSEIAKAEIKKSEIKDLSPEAQAKLELIMKSQKELVTKNAELESNLQIEVDARILKTHIAKASSFKGIVGDKDELGALLMKIQKSDSGSHDKIVEVLNTASEAIIKSKLFEQTGSDSGDHKSGSPMGKLESLAKELVTKSDGKVTKEQALVTVLDSNPELYTEYTNGRN